MRKQQHKRKREKKNILSIMVWCYCRRLGNYSESHLQLTLLRTSNISKHLKNNKKTGHFRPNTLIVIHHYKRNIHTVEHPLNIT